LEARVERKDDEKAREPGPSPDAGRPDSSSGGPADDRRPPTWPAEDDKSDPVDGTRAEPDDTDDTVEETDEDGAEEDEDGGEEADLPPPPDDGPLRVLPIRYLPLAENDSDGRRRPSAEPFRSPAPGEAGRRWQWVPLGALVALLTTTFTWFAAVSLVPQAEESLQAVADSAKGVDGEAERIEIWEDLLEGPQADAVQDLLIAMVVSTVLGLFLAGTIVSYLGRAGALEAGLATATFALMSLLFLGGGIPVMALVGVGIAFGCGGAGGLLGGWLRRKRDARARSAGLR
jgi:hypothetical protein